MPVRRRLFLAGGSGQIGLAVQRAFHDWEVEAPPRAVLDLSDPSSIPVAVRAFRPELVIHAAAQTNVDACEVDPAGAERVNVEATAQLVAAARDAGVLIVYFSTDYVFNGALRRPYREDDEPQPLSVYGRTKWEGEQAVRAYSRHLIVRTSWVYGEGRNFVRTILGAARGGGALRVVDDQVGRPTYAEDVAATVRALIDTAAPCGTYHFQNAGPPASWADVADEALRLAGEAKRVERISTEQFIADRPGRTIAPRPHYSVLDLEKISRLTRPRDWRDALAEYVRMLNSAA